MSGAIYWQWAIPIGVLFSLAAFVGSVFIAERSQQHGDRGIAPRDRWLAGGLFRGAPRALNSRADIPGPDELGPAQQFGPEDELPPKPAEWQATPPEAPDRPARPEHTRAGSGQRGAGDDVPPLPGDLTPPPRVAPDSGAPLPGRSGAGRR